MIANEDMARLAFAAAGFILAAMAMVVFVWRDRRPRADTWQTIVRRDMPPPRERHTRSFEHRHYDVREHEDEREP